MASSFLQKKAKKQAEELEKKYGSSAYGGTTWLNNQLTGKKSSTDDDIAPVSTIKKYSETKKAKEEDEERTWFKASEALDDGFQISDIPKIILGSGEDLSKNIYTGLIGMGEKVVDAFATVAPYVSQAQWNMNGGDITRALAPEVAKTFDESIEQSKKDISRFVSKDLYNEQKVAEYIIDRSLLGKTNEALGIDSKAHSVFGEKTDALAQSGGQLLGQLAANAIAPGSGLALMGVTSFGSEAEGALGNGATLDEAVLSGAISAGAEMLTEKIGGISFGGKTLTDAAFSNLSRHMTSKLAKVLITTGKVTTDALAEGGEEILSGYMSAIGQKLTYMSDKEIEELFSNEDLLESFIGGAVLGGLGGGGDAVKSAIKGVDPVSGLNKNEKAVVDKEYNTRLEEAEANGKLTNSQKNKLYDSVVKDMEKGYISTDTIEEVLGDRSSYDALSKEAEEYDTLYNTPSGQLSKAQQDRLTELDSKNKANPYKDALNVAKDQYSNSVFELVKGDRLSESYNERSRRGQTFEADLTKYDAKQQSVIQKAIDSGILNNTNRTHEFVDLIAKISADKGVSFDFTNNAKLKDSGFAVDGKTVNGYVTKDGVTLNIDSAKSLNSVVGHEITHVLEGTELYDTLKQTVFEYAKTKGEYDSRLSALTETYKSVKDADIDAELAADLVGDYLFTDSDFIHRLSTENRNVFQKIYDEIKYLCKVVTSGSKEARELEKVKKAFEDAYRANGKAEGGTKYSVSDTDGKQLTKEQQEYFKDSKILDANGSLKVMHHGSPETFTVFDKKKAKSSGYYGNGFYFTDSDSHAKQYGNTYDVYLNITNPLQDGTNNITKDQLRKFVEAVSENEDYGIENYGYGATVDSVVDNIYGKSDFAMLMDINATCVGNMVEAIELFNEVNGTNYDGIVAATETVAFYPEQIKSIDNTKPTADKDIRFSLSEAVEETKDLMALHNLTEQKLLKSLKLGGLPMPSVAIARAQDGHGEFGEISLILPKDAIDPQTSSRNKLYSGDAWTPTYPSVDYKPNKNVLWDIDDKISALVPYEVQKELGSLMFDTDNASNYLSKYNGNMVEAYKQNDAMKYAYLKDTGSDISLPMKEADLYLYGGHSNAAVRYLSGKFVNGLQTVELYRNMSARDLLQDKALTEAIADAQNFDVLRTMEPGSDEYLEYERNPAFLAEEVSFRDIDNFLSAARKLFTNGVQQTVDRKAAKELIRDTVDQAAYESWLEELFSGVVEKEGIRNNKDYFTPSGNRRSFEALHYEHNLENVIKAMREKGEKGIGNGFGGASIFGASTTEFSSIEEMKQSRDRLQKMSYDEYQELRKGFTDRFLELAMSLPNERNSFTATDSAAEVLTEAVAKYKTRSGIANYLRRELKGWATYSEQVVDDLIELVNDIRKMPTGYFEAKPQRAVTFDEVGVFVIPNNADVKLKQELLNRGYAIAEYDPNIEGHRQQVVNQFEEYKFSLSKAGEQPRRYGDYNIYGKDIGVNDPLAEFAPVAENTTTETQLTEDNSTPNSTVAENSTVSETESVAPITEESSPVVLYKKRKNGWGDVYATAQEALNDAVRTTDKALWDAFNAEIDNTPQNKQLAPGSTPIINALIAVQEDVRQETITPMQGAQLLSEAYQYGGANALRGLYNPKTGNLYERYLTKAKQYESVAPAVISEKETTTPVTPEEMRELFPDDLAPNELDALVQEKENLENRMLEMGNTEDFTDFETVNERYTQVLDRIAELESVEAERVGSLTDADIPPEREAVRGYKAVTAEDPFADRSETAVGNRSVKAYQYENPEVKPFFREAAYALAEDINLSIPAERWYNDDLYYASGGEQGFGGNSRLTAKDVGDFKDQWKCSWDDLREAVNDIIEDHGKENNALSKRVEFLINDRLMYGYTNIRGERIEPNQAYLDFLKEKQINEYSREAREAFFANAEQYAPVDIAPVPAAPVKAPASVSPYDAMGAAPYGFDPITELQYKYGNLPDGEHPVREDSMPKSITGKDKVSLTARTVKGAGATPDEFVDLLHKETLGGRFSYIPITNSDTVQKAYDEIVKKGWEAARGEWEAKVRRGEVSAELTATGSLLLNHAAKAGDRNAWLSVLHDYQIMGTNAGQAIQAMRILKTLTPDDSLYMIERSVEQMVEDMKLGTEIVIDENLKQNYLNAKTDGERDTARQAIAKDVARQIPSTAMDKWTALRYLNMLGNFRTQGRNIIGNLGMSVTTGARNAVATGIEWLANKASGGKFHRTKSIFVNKDQLKAAKNDFANVKDVALNGGKFNDPMAKTLQFQQEVQDARKIFKIAPLEGYRRATNWAMDTGDLVFSKAAYGRALAGYLKANGIKETDFSKIDQQKLDEARAYAINEAQETTFRDNNWLSSWVSKLGRGKNTPKGVKIVSEGVMPFRKTPANILLRAEEYSPLGIVNATVKSIQAAKGTKNVTGAEVVNSWAKALTGTGLFALGMWLDNSGMLSGGPDEDDDKDWFEDLYGWQNYAIQIGDNNYTIDFLSPAAMPLLMGAQLNELRQTGGVELKDLEKALLSIADPMIEMSMLQGVNDTLDNIRYAESNMGQFLVNACVSYLTQGLTNSFLGQLERSFEGQRMSTYTDKDSDLPAWLQKALGKASAKTPGWDYNQIPYVDAWGETEDIAPLPGFAENALSPSYISQGITDAVYEELNRLNDAQSDINVYPQTPDKTVTFDDAYGVRHEDYNLSAEEYVELAQLQGQTQKEMVEDILSNYRYSGLTDKEKARAVQLAYQYAKEYSRQEVLGADGFSSKWMADAAAEGDLVNAIIAHTNEEMTFAYDYPEKYQFFTENGISWDDYDSADEDTKQEYSNMYSWVSDEDHPGRYAMSKAISDDFQTFWQYKSDCNSFDAKDEKTGETVNGLKKERVIDYINSLDIDYGARLILFRSMYDGKKDKANYDQDIIDYLNSREDISYEDMEAILKELG